MVSELERDLLLDDIKQLYQQVKHTEVGQLEPAIIQTIEQASVKEIVNHKILDFDSDLASPDSSLIQSKEENVKPAINEPTYGILSTQHVTEQIITKAKSLNDVHNGEERSLNKQVIQKPKTTLNQQHSYKNLSSLIDLNKQHVFTQELFKGDTTAYTNAIKYINETTTVEQALEYIDTQLIPQYQWDRAAQSTKLLDKLVRQKFGLN